jgi:hypothetical protein
MVQPFRAGGGGDWYSCREQFLRYDLKGNMEAFLFAHLSKTREGVIGFIKKVEDGLALANEDRLRFYETDLDTATIIVPGTWWCANAARREILTILLRQGQQYTPAKDNFEQALFNHEYTKQTPTATRAFLKGRTVFPTALGFTGWVNMFSEANIKYMQQNGRGSYTPDDVRVAQRTFNNNLQQLSFAA